MRGMERTMAVPESYPEDPTTEEEDLLPEETEEEIDEEPEGVKPQEATAWSRVASRRMGW